MAEITKRILHVPDLPPSVAGDGRYIMTILKQFLALQAEQINAANGFKAEEVEEHKEGKLSMPRNFRLTFTRLGGALAWDHVPWLANLAYYELRTDKNEGIAGLLERTQMSTSSVLPLTYVGHIYLFAVDKEGNRSAPSELHYTKRRPERPQDISLTKTNEGTLITFLEIPLDCIGAHVYVNEERFASPDNVFLYKGQAVIKQVRVAYYDQFGEGESETLYCVLPDVENFTVERNGANLDFFWDAVPVHNVRYVVAVGQTAEWDKALQLFETKLTKHRYVYPNVGRYFMLVKAVDEHDNYSENAAYVVMDTATDASRNVILSLDQEKEKYPGIKINMYYDEAAEELRLEKGALFGEYIVPVALPQVYRARNWYDYKVIGATSDDMAWADVDFPWDGAEAEKLTWNGVIGSLEGASVRHEIARYVGFSATGELFMLDGALAGSRGTIPQEAQHAEDFRNGRWHRGLHIDALTRLSYAVQVGRTFGLSFSMKVTERIDTVFLSLEGADRWLRVGFDREAEEFYLAGSDGAEARVALRTMDVDWLTLAISQTEESRVLFLHSLGFMQTVHATVKAHPLGAFDKLYCYPRF